MRRWACPAALAPVPHRTPRCEACGAQAPRLTVGHDGRGAAGGQPDAVARQRERASWSAPTAAPVPPSLERRPAATLATTSTACCVAARTRSASMHELDLTKRDMTIAYGDRTFALRAYREAGRWSSVVIEHKTPLRL